LIQEEKSKNFLRLGLKNMNYERDNRKKIFINAAKYWGEIINCLPLTLQFANKKKIIKETVK